MDEELLYAHKRDTWIECYLPREVFERFGVAQPAWFKVQAVVEGSGNPNDDEVVEVEGELSAVP